MNIGINAYEANVEHRVGSNVFAYHMLCELEKITRKQHDSVVVYLPCKPVADLPKERDGWKYAVIGPAKFWTQVRLPLALFVRKLQGKTHDVFYSLGHYAPRICPFPNVISIMDLAFIKYPDFFLKEDTYKLTAWTAYSVRQSLGIVTISESSKRDVVSQYHYDPEKIVVSYPGLEKDDVKANEAILENLGVQKPYIVYVGTIQPRKNIVRLIHAFEQVVCLPQHASLQLVLAGKQGWMSDEVIRVAQNSPAASSIKILGFVDDVTKKTLYKYAQMAVLVGLYEGFGIPPLEAMAAGTIPLVSFSSSLPEVVGEAGVLVNPLDVDEIARRMKEILEFTPDERKDMIYAGKEQIKKFRWESAGQTAYELLARVAQENQK